MTRREFLKRSGIALSGAATGAAALAPPAHCAGAQIGAGSETLSIVLEADDELANSKPVKWALGKLTDSLAARKVDGHVFRDITEIPTATRCLIIAGKERPIAREVLRAVRVTVPPAAESLALVSGKATGRPALLASGHDARGLTHALLELADRISHSKEPLAALSLREPVLEHPANQVRGNMRLFASDVEDKTWFNDRAFWDRYLSMLATERFNRFHLALGLGYDFTSGIRDAYFHFAYPFLVQVPGYDVRVSRISDAERDQNLAMLRFVSDETAARGMHFQLGLWTHAYQWTDSPHANHVIEGLTSDKHAAYCRDALGTLLIACPSIGGVTFRIHGESGVAEGSYAFWKTVFEGLTHCGRRVELDMHAKGMDAEMIKVALATGLPVTISPKFWAEHMGLPYHQAGIRPTELPPTGRKDQGFFSKSSGSRSFLRYGYGDLLTEGRSYNVLHRIWPGTQRLLLWGDPAIAAGYGRASSFCGSSGVELFEPLSFKGRKGSGRAGGRDAYADSSLKSSAGDFDKYAYGYRLWGRLLYNPDTQPEVWQRLLNKQYGAAGKAVETGLSSAGRILPLLTTAHTPSAANNNFWPEIYTNMPIVDPKRKHPYGDTPSPKRFGTVSPLDPQLFSRVDDFADELVKGRFGGKYSPLEVSAWLASFADTAIRALDEATKSAVDSKDPAFRRFATDVAIQAGLGHFFSAKLRAAVLYAGYERIGSRDLLQQALAAYRVARQAWSRLSTEASAAYIVDITFGLEAQLRGHWQDRLFSIDEDINDMEKGVNLPSPSSLDPDQNQAALKRISTALSSKIERPQVKIAHLPPQTFQSGVALPITLKASGSHSSRPASATILYRHTNQAESFRTSEMEAQGSTFRATLPADYTDSPFPLQYYFEFHNQKGDAWLHPGLGQDLTNQPYYVVRGL